MLLWLRPRFSLDLITAAFFFYSPQLSILHKFPSHYSPPRFWFPVSPNESHPCVHTLLQWHAGVQPISPPFLSELASCLILLSPIEYAEMTFWDFWVQDSMDLKFHFCTQNSASMWTHQAVILQEGCVGQTEASSHSQHSGPNRWARPPWILSPSWATAVNTMWSFPHLNHPNFVP